MDLGFKKLTPENWSEPDLPVLFGLMTEEVWMQTVLRPTLNPKVPENIHGLYEVARAAFASPPFWPPITDD